MPMKMIKPGLYQDEYGCLHLDIPETLAALKMPDTPATRRVLMQTYKNRFPYAEIVELPGSIADWERERKHAN
jgi:hypothetical protein